MTLDFDERVEVTIADFTTRKFEEYSVRIGVTEQPAAFAVRFGQGEAVSSIIKNLQPGLPFVLSIAGHKQFTGEIDGYDCDVSTSGTRLTYRGRDFLARLQDADVDAEQTFPNTSIQRLVEEALAAVGLADRDVILSNAANIKARSGIPYSIPLTSTSAKPTGFKAVAKFGESWLSFIHRQIAKLGLFLFTDANGNFVIAEPNKSSRALFSIHRRRGQLREITNVTQASLRNDTSRRFSECVVYARNLGRKAGKNHTHGAFVDKEMKDVFHFERPKVFRDNRVSTPQQAQFFARREIAAANRAGYHLEYTLAGHSAPLIGGGHGIITPDIVVKVLDEDFNINEDMYVDSVEYRSPPKTTTVRLMRLKDMVFGAPEQQGGD